MTIEKVVNGENAKIIVVGRLDTQTAPELEKEIDILVSLGDGPYGASAWGCDLTYDYVKINGDYRT